MVALKQKDKKLAKVIEQVGKINRSVLPDLFIAIIHSIVGQQISTKAQKTIWERFENKVHEISQDSEICPKNVCMLSEENVQSCGMSMRKANYILDFSQKVHNKHFDIHALQNMSDEEVIKKLCMLKGIGEWTAEMMMLFSMQRPNILSFGDLAILRGLRMLYQKKEITKNDFKQYKEKFSPYGSTASLYLWEIAGGNCENTMPELIDPAPKKEKMASKQLKNNRKNKLSSN